MYVICFYVSFLFFLADIYKQLKQCTLFFIYNGNIPPYTNLYPLPVEWHSLNILLF